MDPTPPDSDERVFLRVVDAGSLKVAAERMGKDPSAISRRLSALEERLGQRLLKRSTGGSRPTEAGARYYEGLLALVEQQDALEASIAGAKERPQGTLRVTAPPEFGVRFVVPPLQELQRRHPDLRIELSLGTVFSDLNAEDIDVAIRIGVPSDSALTVRRLGHVARVAVAAPSYLKAHGFPERLEDLAAHRFVGYRATSTPLELSGKASDGAIRRVQVRPFFVVNSIPSIVAMVVAGAGVSVSPRWAFREALSDGVVQELLASYEFPAAPLNALYRERRYVPAKTRAFLDAVAAHLKAEQALSS